MEKKKTLRIVVASPGDVPAERDLLSKVIQELNRGIAAVYELSLELSRWETDTYPGFHADGPQGLIDPIIKVADCDLLVGIFWKRFGTPIPDGQTGTEHEINLAVHAWTKTGNPQIFVYFNQQPYTPKSKSEADQWGRVLEFREKFPAKGLWWDYNGERDFEEKVRNHLTNYIREQFKPKRETAKPQTSTSLGRSVEDLLTDYRRQLKAKVGKVYLLGEAESRDLKEVFVELTVNEHYDRPKANDEWLAMWDAELRKRYFGFGNQFGNDEREQRRIKPAELLQRQRPAVIAGAPGCGKTTLMRWLALQACDAAAQRVPLFVELKALNQKAFENADAKLEPVLIEYAVKQLKDENAAEASRLADELSRLLKAGQLAVLLDGLDEVLGWETFPQLRGAITRFLETQGKNAILISSRPFALRDSHFRSADEMEIASFNHEQIALFLKHYYGEAEERKLRPQLMRAEVRDLVSVPTLIGAVVRRIRESGTVETNRLKLYEGIVTDLVSRIDSQKETRRFQLKDDDGRLKLALLKQLAFERLFDPDLEAGSEAERVTFTTDFIERAARRCCGTVQDAFALAADVKATPLMREVAENVWAFSHLTLQEYLAAKALADALDGERMFVRACFHPLLVEMETLPMALGLVRRPDRLYEVLAELPESLDYKLLRLQARGLAAARVKPTTLQKLVDRLDDFVTTNRPEEQAYYDVVVNAFVQARGAAAGAIVERLILYLESSPDSSVRGSAASSLGSIGSERAVDALLKALLEDQDSSVRWSAASSLGSIGSEKPEALVVGLLLALQSSWAPVRRKAAEVLGYYVCEDGLVVLEQVAASDVSADRTETVRGAIARLRSKLRYFAADDGPPRW